MVAAPRRAARVPSEASLPPRARSAWLTLPCLAALALVGREGLRAPSSAFAAPRSGAAAPRSRRAAQGQDVTSLNDARDNGWYMMPLGVPKVAYRIPGAPNADWIDIYNRLYRERIIFIGKEIDDRVANEIIGVLLYLDSEDSGKPIYIYINSPGGSVLSGMALYDTMQHIKSPVVTINVGLAGSMASFLLASGEKGKRIALPHSRVMIHQAMGGAQGQAEDIKVEATQILQIQDNIVRLYAKMTGQPEETIRQDLMRDNFMSAEKAKEYGLIDQIIQLSDATDLPSRTAAEAGEAPKGEAEPVPAPAPAPAPSSDEPEDVKPVM